jgi:hypothetical protein
MQAPSVGPRQSTWEGQRTLTLKHTHDLLAIDFKFWSKCGVRFKGNQYPMVAREKELVVINQTMRYIAIVIG